jgi:CubicO group peptidase (beta-lactamase class C family)
MKPVPTQTWLALIVAAVGLLLAAILGLWGYMSVTATPLHPTLQNVPSVTRSAPLPKWADAVEQGRQIVRAGLTEQNLPGISVAVGVGRDLVWAEGFGWADLENQVKVTPQTRFRIGTASTALTSAGVGPAAGERPTETRRRDSDVLARVPGEAVARDTAPVDGASGRRQKRRR